MAPAESTKFNWRKAHDDGRRAQSQGRSAEAEALYKQVLAVRPNDPDTLQWLGTIYANTNRAEEAIPLFRRVIELKPYHVDAWTNLGTALLAKGRAAEALEAYRRAVVLKPDMAIAHSNLATALVHTEEIDGVAAEYRKALELDPKLLQAMYGMAGALSEEGRPEEGIPFLERFLKQMPREPVAHSTLVAAYLYFLGDEGERIFREHARWNLQHAEIFQYRRKTFTNDPSPERRLRVGYVSRDFTEHAVAFFFQSLIAHHDPAAVETFCYSDTTFPDVMTERLKGLAQHWRDSSALDVEQFVAAVREDQIDILVDLAGHTVGNRLTAFARKPAPVQVTYLGYAATTGLNAMDYRLTDAIADPPGMTDAFYSEKLVRLPGGFLCYAPPAPEEALPPRLPRDAAGQIVFGSSNATRKIRPEMVATWAAILKRVPGSRMVLKSMLLKEGPPRQHLRELFAAHDIHDDRVQYFSKVPEYADHLAFYRGVDIALDTYPYNGTTTTCEALWMGVPVISMAGKTHLSRVGASILERVGLGEFVVGTREAYVAKAIALAQDMPRLEGLRAGMRDRLRASPLLDGPRLAREIEAAYREMWRTWCAGAAARS